jgi:hypothetical protein
MDTLASAIIGVVNRLDGVDGRIVHALPPEAYCAHGRTRLNNSLRASGDRISHTAHRLTHLAAQLARASEQLLHDQSRWDAADRDRRLQDARDRAKAEEARRDDAARRR